eukprot:1137364-Pelagomonas_calceolata.AAC.2
MQVCVRRSDIGCITQQVSAKHKQKGKPHDTALANKCGSRRSEHCLQQPQQSCSVSAYSTVALPYMLIVACTDAKQWHCSTRLCTFTYLFHHCQTSSTHPSVLVQF